MGGAHELHDSKKNLFQKLQSESLHINKKYNNNNNNNNSSKNEASFR